MKDETGNPVEVVVASGFGIDGLLMETEIFDLEMGVWSRGPPVQAFAAGKYPWLIGWEPWSRGYGGDSCSRVHEFESIYWRLDVHFGWRFGSNQALPKIKCAFVPVWPDLAKFDCKKSLAISKIPGLRRNIFSKIITTPTQTILGMLEDDRGGVLLVGGRLDSFDKLNTIYRLAPGDQEWKLLQRLKMYREYPVVMVVPERLTTCSWALGALLQSNE